MTGENKEEGYKWKPTELKGQSRLRRTERKFGVKTLKCVGRATSKTANIKTLRLVAIMNVATVHAAGTNARIVDDGYNKEG